MQVGEFKYLRSLSLYDTGVYSVFNTNPSSWKYATDPSDSQDGDLLSSSQDC